MTLHEEQKKVQKAVEKTLAFVQEDPWLAQRVLANAKGEEPVVKKISAAFVLIMVLAVITVTALAAGIIYNQNWYYNNRGSALKEHQPEVYEAVMANLTENPEQVQSEDDLVSVVIQDVAWMPEAQKMTISFRASVKDPSRYELHGMWALDTDGAYVGEGGSTTATNDSEERAMHWLFRSFETDDYAGPARFGPPLEMMDDNTKTLLLIDRREISLFDGALQAVGSMDMLRTPEGDIVFVEEIDLTWLSEDYDAEMAKYAEQYPDMAQYAEEQIAAARTGREKLAEGTIPCTLNYTVVEYTEGMDDLELYTGGRQGQIDFVIQPKKTEEK